MKLNKLRITLIVLLCSFLLCLFAFPFFQEKMIVHYLTSYSKKKLDLDLTFQNIKKQNSKWIITTPSFLKKGDQVITADQMIIGYHLHPLDWSIDLFVEILKPTVRPFRIDLESSEEPKKSSEKTYFLGPSIRSEVAVNDGLFFSSLTSIPYSFSLTGSRKNVSEVSLQAAKIMPEQAPESLFLHYSNDNQNSKKAVNIAVENLDCCQITHVLRTLFSPLEVWEVSAGNMTGNCSFDFETDRFFPKAMTGDLTFNQFKVLNHALGLFLDIPKATITCPQGSFPSLNLSEKASIAFDNGKVATINEIQGSIQFPLDSKVKVDLSGFCNQTKWQLIDIEEKDPSTTTLKFLSECCESKLSFNFSAPEKMMGLSLSGRCRDLALMGPELFQKGIVEHFDHDTFLLDIALKQNKGEIQTTGSLEVTNFSQSKSEKIYFGMDWAKKIGSNSPENHWFSKTLYRLGIRMQNGWIEAQNIPLNKYIAPFVLNNQELDLTGWGNIHGGFDDNSLVVSYDAHGLILENEYFSFEMGDLRTSDSNHSSAFHYFEFATGMHGGVIPITNGSYFEKNSGLFFTDITSELTVGMTDIYATDVKAYFEGIYLGGDIRVALPDRHIGLMAIAVNTHTLSGPFSDLKNAFSHFKATQFLENMPIDGNVFLRQEGAFMFFSISPKEVTVKAKIDGAITDGFLPIQSSKMVLQDLSLNFSYDHENNTLDITDIEGGVIISSSDTVEEYVFTGDYFKFSDFRNQEGKFDFWVGDKQRDILRLVGKIQPHTSHFSTDSPLIEVLFDKGLTHFGDVHPKIFSLALKDWSKLEFLDLKFDFRLQTMLQEIQRLSRTGLLPLSEGVVKLINSFKCAEGDFQVAVGYNNQDAVLSYEAKSQNVLIGNYHSNTCLLQGTKKDNSWNIDQLSVDDISMSAEISKHDKEYHLGFFGIRCGDFCLAGLEGKFSPEKSCFSSKINLFELELEKISSLPLLSMANTDLKGFFKGTGTLLVSWLPESNRWHTDLYLQASIKDFSVKDFQLKDTNNFLLEYKTNDGFHLRNFESGFVIAGATQQPEFSVLYGEYSDNRELNLEKISFSMPSEHMQFVKGRVQEYFPQINGTYLEAFLNAKRSGILSGCLTLKYSPLNGEMVLELPRGKYFLKDSEYDIDNFTLECNPIGVKFSTVFLLQGSTFLLKGRAAFPELSSGELTVTTQKNELQPLTMTWKLNPEGRFSIEDAVGVCAGTRFDLHHVPETESTFSGEVIFSLPELIPFLPVDLKRQSGELNVGGKYFLKGIFNINNLLQTFDIGFTGHLEGKNFQIKGFTFEKCHADMNVEANAVTFSNCFLNDNGGVVQADKIAATRTQNNLWMVSIPKITLQELFPMRLRRSDNAQSYFKIKNGEVIDFIAEFSNVASYRAKGSVNCENPPEKDYSNPIFRVPKELFSAVGLDLSSLNPVTGTVHFNIEGNRIYLTKFKDVYSEGENCKFSLAKKSEKPSYIDFDGNLFVQIKMKQHNLLMKLANLFTVTITGTVDKPVYSLLQAGAE